MISLSPAGERVGVRVRVSLPPKADAQRVAGEWVGVLA